VAQIHQHRITQWVEHRGWLLGRMHDESSLAEAIERIESRESDGLVVARVSHLGSSLEDALAAIERIQAAGGRFISLCERIDLDTPAGKQILRILLSLPTRHPEQDERRDTSSPA